MALGRKTGGRKPGSPNKRTLVATQVIEEVFRLVGGVEAMRAWALEHPTEFYAIYSKLLPRDIRVDHRVNIAEELQAARMRIVG